MVRELSGKSPRAGFSITISARARPTTRRRVFPAGPGGKIPGEDARAKTPDSARPQAQRLGW